MNDEELKEMLKLYTKKDLWEFNQIKAKKQIELMAQIKEQDQKIKELEHRLSNCIEPKFKKGDLVFANTVAYWENEKPVRHTTEQEVEEIIYFYKLKNYDYKNWEIDEVFSTYNEAKEKLNEIQGDKR